ncbi:MAG: PD40 domain-containing protein [Deltaproteobacteria bacterium]|nr:PD40 domain-containing protein [Deltaproteobacteria bacterium]
MRAWRPAVRIAVLGTVLAAVLAATSTARAGDPLRVRYTIETDHFVIHYYDPLEDVARRVAVVAERAHRVLTPALDHRPTTKTIINVVDDTDSANGFAGVLPRNAITLFATAPGSFTELDDHEDWLYGLTAHEYTHIIHIDTMEGLPSLYNKVFGKIWAPNQVMPRWVIEGIATYEESKRSAGGRNRGTRFDQYIRTSRLENKDLRLDEVTGAPRRFPRGNAAYVYGSHFLRYVFDRFGDDTLREMSHTSGRHPVPFATNRQIAKVTGKPFTELYGDWKDYLRDRYGMQEMAAERRGLAIGRRLTHSAEANFFAQYSADGKEIYWLQSDGYRRPHVRAMPVGGDHTNARDVAKIEAMGPFELLTDGSFIFEQGGWLHRREYAFQDLFRWDARTGVITRLSRGARARDPGVSPDGRRVAFSKNEVSESVLAVMDTAPGATSSVIWRGQRFDQAFQPAWSPDGTRIAFSAWRRGGFRDILVVEVASGAVEEITADRAVDMNPAWSADGRTLYFDSDRTGITNIYAWDTADRALSQVTNVLGGAFRPNPSPDGTRLVFDAAVPAGGYDLYELPIDRSAWLPARSYLDDKPDPLLIPDHEAQISDKRPYRALETLAPQTWNLQYVLGDDPSATISTGGADSFNVHTWQLAVGTNLENGTVNLGAFYGYGGWRQSLRLAASRTIGTRGGFRVDGEPATYRQEDWSATVSTSIPFEARPDSSWSMSFDYDVDWFRPVEEPLIMLDPNDRVTVRPVTDYVQAGVGMRLGYSRVRGTTYGLGPQSGFDISAGLRFDHPALGATYNNITVSYSTSTFQRLWGDTPVISARLAGSLRAGDLARSGGFGLGGIPPQDLVRAIIDSTRAGSTGYLRGYPARHIVGNQFHLLNLEYRQELWRIERGVGTLPFYVRRMHMALLSDTGTAFETEFVRERHLRASVGGALRVDAFFGYFVPGTFELGYARGLTEGGVSETWLMLTGSF